MAIAGHGSEGQLAPGFAGIGAQSEVYEYGVLVTSVEEEVPTLAQLYRDRADSENPFDELKNQWGWAGFTTRDLARCSSWPGSSRSSTIEPVRAARRTHRHLEAITCRPLLLSAIAERTRHARRTTLKVAGSHAKAGRAAVSCVKSLKMQSG